MGAASPSPVHPYVQLATDAIDDYVRDCRVITPPDALFERHPALRGRAGVFVSLKKRGELRGCIGTIEPAQENLALEIIENAISAATKDPRFRPVVEEELPELRVSVRSEEHTSELQSRLHLVCRLLLEKKKKKKVQNI